MDGVTNDGNTLKRAEIYNRHSIFRADIYPTMTRTRTAASGGTCGEICR